MPSSPGYVRNYAQEYKTAKARGENGTGHNSGSAERHRLRRKALKLGMVKKGQDVDHIKPLSKGGANTIKNARAVSPHANRGFPRRKDGSMKSNT
jgi:5-methylcytosine-specific restriction endonuclease McrA